MENRKVLTICCFAIAIAIAIASVFGTKNAFAQSISGYDYSATQPGRFYVRWTDGNISGNGNVVSTTGVTGINRIQFTNLDGSNYNLPAKSYTDIQFQVYELKSNVNPNIFWAEGDLVITNQSYYCNSNLYVTGSGVTLNSDNSLVNYRNRCYWNFTVINNSDNAKNLVINSSAEKIIGVDVVIPVDTWQLILSDYPIYTKNSSEQQIVENTKTTSDYAKKQEEANENIENQDKSGDDYGTGNKQESLLNAIKRFGEALTYKKGNCLAKIPSWGKITGGMTLDLCNTGVAMTGLSVILSVVAIFFFIPLSKSWLDTIIGLIREMQG